MFNQKNNSSKHSHLGFCECFAFITRLIYSHVSLQTRFSFFKQVHFDLPVICLIQFYFLTSA